VTGDGVAASGVDVEWHGPLDLVWSFLLAEVEYSLYSFACWWLSTIIR
jgi:hypothetical protein